MTILVVGGGGRAVRGYAANTGRYGGGGGSGYLEYRSLQVSAGSIIMAKVGDGGQSSSLTISDGDTITAQPGEDNQGYSGGNGYSGGGGSGRVHSSGVGGSNGGDGEDGSHGNGASGTGQNVSIFTFTTWSLGPGAGGRYDSGNYYYGGGGGGLLVNGAGPQGNVYQGKGYGGGGGAGAEHPGLILVEIGQ